MSDIAFKTANVVTTELGRINQLSAAVATKFLLLKETTLNAKYGILPNATINTFPRIRYFGIGIKGCASISSEMNITQPYMPSPANMDLYQPIPFRCTRNELSATEAAKYRLHREVTINGTTYHQYWLKLLEFETDTPIITTVNGNIETSKQLDTANLTPTPTELSPTDVSNSTGPRTEVSLTAIRRVTGAEVTEVINAMYGGDLRRARISEFGLYSGVEAVDNSQKPEAVYVQLASHMCTVGHDLSNPDSTLIERCVLQNGALIQV